MTVRGTCIAVFCILMASYSYVYGGLGSNQNARFDMLAAIVRDGSLTIDKYQKNTGDKALYKGHFYTSKPPGITFLALPAYFGAQKYLEAIGSVPRNWTSSKFMTWMTVIGSVGLLASLGGVGTFLSLRRLVKDSFAFLVTMFAFLGTPIFPYATVLFSHAGTAGLIAIALACAVAPKKKMLGWMALLCGLSAGFAVSGELASGIPAAGAVAYLAFRAPRKIPMLIVGLLPGAALLLGYNWLVFDNPFTVGYTYEFTFPDMIKTGFMGIDVTQYFDRLPVLLFYPNKGLFFWAPVLLLAAGGVETLYRKHRSLFWLVFGVVVLHLLLIASHRSSLGGSAISARNYLSLIPYLAIPTALGFVRVPKFGTVVGAVSVALAVILVLVGVQVNQKLEFPLVSHYFAKLANGTVKNTLFAEFLDKPNISSALAATPLIVWITTTVSLVTAALGNKTPRFVKKLKKAASL